MICEDVSEIRLDTRCDPTTSLYVTYRRECNETFADCVSQGFSLQRGSPSTKFIDENEATSAGGSTVFHTSEAVISSSSLLISQWETPDPPRSIDGATVPIHYGSFERPSSPLVCPFSSSFLTYIIFRCVLASL